MSDEATRRASESVGEAGTDAVDKVAAAIRNITTSAGKPAAAAKADVRNAMLEALVYGDNDLVGLVAYAMHEVNRRDWCVAFEAGNARPPSDSDVKAYLVGEQLERRLDTYRRLAEDALAKVANPEQNMRRLAESMPEPAKTSIAAPAQAVRAAPAPAPMPAPASMARSFEVSAADQAIVPAQRPRKWGGLLFNLLLLLVAVVVVAWIIRNGLTLPSLPK